MPSSERCVTESPEMATATISARLDDLRGVLAPLGGAVVAFSGGTDSALVAAMAARTLGERALAVTAVSPSLPPGELGEARRVARHVGIRHLAVRTHETERDAYLANGVDRCYHCKTELYEVLWEVASDQDLPHVLSGANVDDLGDYRPGLRAAAERSVRHPLVEAGFGKAEVREAAPCLSSRIAFGVRITVDELRKVGKAERLLKDLGFREVRVRVHDDLARVEVEAEEVHRLTDPDVRGRIVAALKDLGYRYVTVDLEGFRSGSMNPPGEAGPA